MPLIAFLSPRILACHRCLDGFLSLLFAGALPLITGEATICDYCLKDADNLKELAMQTGPILFYGNACIECTQECE
jgi:hypothetical protein